MRYIYLFRRQTQMSAFSSYKKALNEVNKLKIKYTTKVWKETKRDNTTTFWYGIMGNQGNWVVEIIQLKINEEI